MTTDHEVTSLSDEDLVILTLEHPNNFSFIVERYQKKLLFYIRRISGVSEEDAEDMLQEIFVKMYTNLNSFNADLKFSSWAYRISHNHVISTYRKKQARPQGVSFDAEEGLLQKLVSDLNLEVELDRKLLREHIYTLFQKMPVKYREVLVLKYFEEKSYDEIADILKKPVGTVGTLLNRAKKQFKLLYSNE